MLCSDLNGKEIQKTGVVSIHICTLCCTVETNVKQLYSDKKNYITPLICSVLFRVTFILRQAIPGGSSEVFPGGAVVKNPPAKVDERDAGLIPRSGRLPRVGKGNPLQYSCLENSLERGAWQAIQSMEVQRVRLSWARVRTHTHTQAALNLHPHGLETSADKENLFLNSSSEGTNLLPKRMGYSFCSLESWLRPGWCQFYLSLIDWEWVKSGQTKKW